MMPPIRAYGSALDLLGFHFGKIYLKVFNNFQYFRISLTAFSHYGKIEEYKCVMIEATNIS